MEHPEQTLALAGMITGHAGALPDDVVRYYLTHRDQIPNALRRGFVLPIPPQPLQVPPPPTHDAVYEHLFGTVTDAVPRLSLNRLDAFGADYSTVPPSHGFVRQVYVPPESTVAGLLKKLERALSADPSCLLGTADYSFDQLPHPMMRREGWFLVDFGPTTNTRGYDVLRDMGEYAAGLVALAGYLMYPKLAMYAGRDYKGLNIPKQVVPGIQARDCCLVIGQGDFNPVRPYPCIVSGGLDTVFTNCAFPRIVWPTL